MLPSRLAALGLPALVALVLVLPAASSRGQQPALSVIIASPAGGATLRGPTRFSVRVPGPRPERVDFYLNGLLRHVDRRPPFAYKAGSVQLSELRRGRNTLRVVARRGSARAERRITVFVAQAQPAPALKLPRIPWEGGPAFYERFAKAQAQGWSKPAFFPISVFLGKPEHAGRMRALGINTYMGAEHYGSMTAITNTGMFVLPQRDEWTIAQVGDNPRAVGWLITDECDMGLGGCDGKDEHGNLAILRGWVNELRAHNDGRFMQANFGNGVLGTFWAPRTMHQFVQALDVSSVDKYAYTSPHNWGLLPSSPHWPKGAPVARSGAYGWLARRMRTFQDPRNIRPTWVFVETAMPFLTESGARTITPDQVEGAVWSAIINEARGIAYFQHNNNDTCDTYSILDCGQPIRDKLTAVHRKIRSLAPAINTQSYRYDFKSGTETMLKTYDGHAYIFAGIGLNQTTGTKTFTLPAGVKGTTVIVEGEGRKLPVVNGRFTDGFASEYSHHVYRVTLGSR